MCGLFHRFIISPNVIYFIVPLSQPFFFTTKGDTFDMTVMIQVNDREVFDFLVRNSIRRNLHQALSGFRTVECGVLRNMCNGFMFWNDR